MIWGENPLFSETSRCLEGGSFKQPGAQRSRGLGIARVRGRRGGCDAPEAPPLVIAEADAALSAQRLRSDVAVKRGVIGGGNLPKVGWKNLGFELRGKMGTLYDDDYNVCGY